MSSISYIVPCWINDEETLQITKQAIESFKEATPNAELVLIDNASLLGGGWMRSEASLYLRCYENKGYTYAMNYGLQIASGEILAMVNNDIRLAPNWVEAIQPILEDPTVSTVHPRMTGYTVPFVYGDHIVKTGKERWCQNSCVFTTKTFLKRFREQEIQEPYPGLFDTNYGIGGGADDWDFFYRIRTLGYQTVYTDRTCFQHVYSHSLQKLGPAREKIVADNKRYFVQKFGAEPEVLFAKAFPEQMKVEYAKGFDL